MPRVKEWVADVLRRIPGQRLPHRRLESFDHFIKRVQCVPDGEVDALCVQQPLRQAPAQYEHAAHSPCLDVQGGIDQELRSGAQTLADAQAYADAGDAQTLADAQAYADAGDEATLAAANSYTDQQVFNANAATLQTAQTYTDTRETAIRGDMATADAQTLQSAQAYADAGDAQTLQSAQDYADNGDAETLQSANAYTDARFA